MPKVEYCTYTYSHGYLVNIYEGKEHVGYGFKNVHVFSKKVQTFSDSMFAELSRNYWSKYESIEFWSKCGFTLEKTRHIKGPIRGTRTRIAGTDIDLPLPGDI